MSIHKYISSFIRLILLLVFMTVHVCTAVCSVGMLGSCTEMNGKELCHKSCCQSKTHNDSNSDCQQGHMAFFSTIGQSQLQKTEFLKKAFQSFESPVHPLLILFLHSERTTVIAFNGFHPPPIKPDIRISIQSFQI